MHVFGARARRFAVSGGALRLRCASTPFDLAVKRPTNMRTALSLRLAHPLPFIGVRRRATPKRADKGRRLEGKTL